MEKKLIDLHYEWKKEKRIPYEGLCTSIPIQYKKTLNIFQPDINERQELYINDESSIYWGAGKVNSQNRYQGYTRRRQVIVLLICAMHGEL